MHLLLLDFQKENFNTVLIQKIADLNEYIEHYLFMEIKVAR